MGEAIKLIGILIIVLGFTFKLDVIAVVLVSGVVTGLVSGLGFNEILSIMGESFINNRLMSIFILSLPVIAIIERNGLKEKAAELIGKIKNASAGKILSIYSVIRTAAAALSIRLGGHVQFVRPLILPMSEAAGKVSKGSDLTDKETEKLKGLSAAIENYGNFFGQNIFIGSSGVLLIQGALMEAGYDVTLQSIAVAAIPVGIIAIVFSIIQVKMYDRKVKGGGK